MAIYYSPFPSANPTPAGTNYNFVAGDYYVTSTGTPYKAGVSGSRLAYTSYSGTPKPYGTGTGSAVIPSLTPNSLATPITVAVNQIFTNQATISAYGGSAVQATGGTSLALPGITPVYNISWSPALPSWLTATYVKSVSTVSVSGVSNLYNQIEVQVSGTAPATAISRQTYIATFTDGSGLTVTASFTLEPAAVAPPPSPPVASNISQTVTYNSTNNTITLSATNSPTSVAVATNPSHGTATASGTTIKYTPTSGYYGSDTFTYTATNAGGTSSPATVTITVTQPFTVTSAVVGTKQIKVGVATTFNSVTVTAPGTTPYTYSIDTSVGKPALPAGLAIDNTGAISGNVSSTVILKTYTVKVTDSTLPTNQTSSATFDMEVLPNPPVAVVSATTAKTQGVTYTAFNPISVQSGTGTAPYSYALTGAALPTGMSYSSSGAVSGKALDFTNQATTYSVRITDSLGQYTDTAFILQVNQLPNLTAIVNPAYAINTVTTGVLFSATPVYASASASGYGTLTYAINNTITGLTFDTTNGLLSGNPSSTLANATYTVTILDQATPPQTSQGSFQLKIIAPPPSTITLTKNTNSLPLVVGTSTNLPSTPITASGGVPGYTYSISPALPDGLSYNSVSGQITGIANTSTPNGQAVAYIVSVTDQYPQTSTSSFNLTVTTPPAINISTAVPNVGLVQNIAITTTYPSGLRPVVATGGYLSQLTYSINPSLVFFGLTFDSGTGSITGTPSSYWTTSTPYAVTVRDSARQVSTSSFNLVVSPPAFSVTTNPAYASQTFTKTVPISIFQPVRATGGAQPYVLYELDNNNIGGLSFNSSTGQISGTPTQQLNTTSYKITITDSIGTKGTSSFSIYIANADPLYLVATPVYAVNTLTVGSSVGLPLTPAVLTSKGYGTVTYDINPKTLPNGLTFANGTITSTPYPQAPLDTTVYTISVYDSLPVAQTTSTTFSLTVKYPELVTTLVTNSISLTNKVYTSTQQLITFTGGAQQGVTYSISPQLPSYPVLQFLSPGIIQGTPGSTVTNNPYTLTITDNITGLYSSKNINVSILDPTPLTNITTGSTVILTVNAATNNVYPVKPVGGYGVFTYSLSGSANGTLSIKSATGELTGIPNTLSAPTSYSITIKDSANQVTTGTFNLSVISTPILIVQNAISVPLIVGATTNIPAKPIGATGGTPPYTYGISPSLPSGLTFVGNTGNITGIAATGTNGVVPYNITVSDPYQSNTGSFNLNVTYPLPITLSTLTNVTLVQGTQASTTYPSGLIPINAAGTGYLSLTYAIDKTLPAGLAFSTSTGSITGTPSVYYTTSTPYAVTVRDQASQINTGTFNLVVQPPVFNVRTNAAYANQSLTNTAPITPFQPVYATGGATPYSYKISSYALGGLSFSTATGIISGTPNQLISSSYDVTITDLLGSVGTSSFSLSIVTARALTISTVPQYVDNSLTVNTATNFTPVVLGSSGYGTLTFDIQPTLPPDLTFSNGVISGTPRSVRTTGTYTVTVTDSLPIHQTSSTQFTISVAYTPFTTSLTTSTVKLTKGTQASTKVINYAGGGGSGVSYSTIPDLPEYPNVQLVSPGVISGTPVSTSTTATYALVVTDNVTGQTSTQYISLNVAEPSSIILYGTATNVFLYANSATTGITAVSALGGIGALNYSISSTRLPNGTLGISPTTGVLTGTPANVSPSGIYNVTVSDTQDNRSTATFNLTVSPPPITLTIINPPSKVLAEYAQIATPFQPVSGTNLNYGGLRYTINPQIDVLGLDFNTGSGFISGTPVAAIGGTPYNITVSDQNGQSSTGTFNLTITPSTPPALTAVVPQNLQVITVGEVVNFQPVIGQGGFLISGNDYAYSITPLIGASGISYNTATGYLVGTALSSASVVTYAVSIKDNVPQSTSTTFQLRVDAAPPVTAAKGYSGSIGYAGSRGYAGSVGPQGPGGYAGSLGYAGSRGYAGSAGPTGPQGPGGYAGSLGYAGSVGYSGSTGYTGSQGTAGYDGSRGIDGYSGSTGYDGSRGVDGYDGSRGIDGYSGSTGYTGSQGNIGYFGSTGYTGSASTVPGYSGSKGDPGTSVRILGSTSTSTTFAFNTIDPTPTLGDGILVNGVLWVYTGGGPVTGFENVGNIQGPTGYTGYTGSQGNIGYFGSTGYTGSGGYLGSTGYTGSSGYWGSVGYTGSQGNIGYFGSTGYTGSQGNIGYFGSTGYAGSGGYLGSTGYTGSQGNIGYFGSTGYTGSQGCIGYFGSTGYDGSQGNIGYTGSVGYTGSQGQGFTFLGQWLNGYSYVPYDVVIFGGESYVNILATDLYLPSHEPNWTKILNRGDTGYTGSQGITGFTGSKGNVGYTGSRGYIGSLGYAGSVGYQGSQGFKGDTGYTGSQGSGLQISGYVGSSGALPNPYGGSIGTIYASGDNSHLWIWVGAMWVDLGAIGYTGSYAGGGGGGGMGGSPNLDGGTPSSNYGGIASICGGGVSI